MTVTEPATTTRRPSPHPRPAERPVASHLHVVPNPTTLQSETATAENTPLDHVSAGHDLTDGAHPGPAAELSAESPSLWARSKAYWTPPEIFTDRPASLAELGDYAKYAPWAHQPTGLLRKSGVGYYRGIAYPYTVISRYREWIAQRPGRLLPALGLIKLISFTGPGNWAVDHIVYPAAQLVGHIIL